MWKCVHCRLEIMFRAVEPEIDQGGIYFLCLGCSLRNMLVNVRTGGAKVLAQT